MTERTQKNKTAPSTNHNPCHADGPKPSTTALSSQTNQPPSEGFRLPINTTAAASTRAATTSVRKTIRLRTGPDSFGLRLRRARTDKKPKAMGASTTKTIISASMLFLANAKVSGVQHGAPDRAKMAKPCPSRRGMLNVRVSRRRTA